MMHSSAFLLLLLPLVSLGQEQECPFGPGSCPVTLDNVIEVFFHDINDNWSCQIECNTIGECKHFTMFGVADPVQHKKCFLFKTCDYLEPCNDCVTGPEYPPIDPCLGGNFTCETTLNNIVDIYYFDTADDFSCKHQCSILDNCFWWTQFHTLAPNELHKCFLYKTCDVHENCPSCETGPKP